jgi:hypothetical protein
MNSPLINKTTAVFMLNNVPRYFFFISLKLKTRLGMLRGTHRKKRKQNIMAGFKVICKK